MRFIFTALFLLSIFMHPVVAQLGWVAVDEPFPNQNWMDVDFLNDDFGFVCGEQGRIKRTTNGGADWEFRETNVDVTLDAVHVVNSDLIFASGHQGTLLKSLDGGDTWTSIATGTAETLLDVLFFDEMEGFICGSKSTLLKTTDGGSSWEPQNSRFNNNNIWQMQAFDRENLIICGNAGNISYTTNGGERWRSQETNFPYEIYSISFSDTSNGYAVGVNATIMKTTNGGDDWAIIDPGFPLPTLPLNGVATPTPNHTYICGWNAMIVGRWNGTSYEVQKVPSGYAGKHLTGICFPSAKTGYIVGWDGTILKTDNGGTLPVERLNASAVSSSLSTAYPNPAVLGQDVTAVFTLAERDNVTISLYDLLGKKVRDIAVDEYQTGSYSITIDTHDLSGGMYMLRLITSSGTFARQLAIQQ